MYEKKKKDLENEDPREKLKKKMRASISIKRDFKKEALEKKKKIKSKSPNQKSNQNNNNLILESNNRPTTSNYRKRKKENLKNKPKVTIKLNAYKNVDQIMNFIDNTKNLKNNKYICDHFKNIAYQKEMDEMKQKLIKKNRIKPISDADINIKF